MYLPAKHIITVFPQLYQQSSGYGSVTIDPYGDDTCDDELLNQILNEINVPWNLAFHRAKSLFLAKEKIHSYQGNSRNYELIQSTEFYFIFIVGWHWVSFDKNLKDIIRGEIAMSQICLDQFEACLSNG